MRGYMGLAGYLPVTRMSRASFDGMQCPEIQSHNEQQKRPSHLQVHYTYFAMC